MKLKKLLTSLALAVILIGTLPLNAIRAVDDQAVDEKNTNPEVDSFYNPVSLADPTNPESPKLEPMVNPGDEKLPGIYGIYLTGNQTANNADTETSEAVLGDVVLSAEGDAAGFTIAGMFDPNVASNTNFVGVPVNSRQKISLLLGGLIKNNGKFLHIKQNVNDKGYFVPQSDNLPLMQPSIDSKLIDLTPDLRPNTLTMSPEEMADTFEALAANQAESNELLADLVANPVPFDGGSVTLTTVNGAVSTVVQQSSLEEGILVVKVPTVTYGSERVGLVPELDYNPAFEKLINSDDVKQIIFTSDAKKILFHGSDSGFHTDFFNVASHKVSYYLPAATQITGFRPNSINKDTRIPDLGKDGNGKSFDMAMPIDENGNDKYSYDYVHGGHFDGNFGAIILGSVIAPDATILLAVGSSINGYVRAKNLHQRYGSEVHNFYTPLLSPLVLNLKKLGKDGLLPGATFTLTDLTSKEVRTLDMTDTPEFKGVRLHHKHKYVLQEDTAPVGYDKIDDIHFEVDALGKVHFAGQTTALSADPANPTVLDQFAKEGNVTASLTESDAPELGINVRDQKATAKIKFYKKSHSQSGAEAPLAGAKFLLYAANKDGSAPDFDKATPLEGTLADPIVSASDGSVQFETPLEENQILWVREIEAPAGYALVDPFRVTVKMQQNGADSQLEVVDVNGKPIGSTPVYDEQQPASLIVTKQGMNGEFLQGAEFTLYKYDATKPNDRGGQVGEPVLTDAKGEINFKNLDWSQKYVVVETKAPTGYQLPKDGSQQTIDFRSGDKLSLSLTAAFTDTLKPITIHLNKVSKWLGNQLEGAEFTLFDQDNNQIGKPITTGKAGDDTWNFALTGLEAGQNYTLKETKAPAGYTVDHKAYTVVVAEDGKRVTVTPVDAQEDEKEGQTVNVVLKDGEAENLGDGVVTITNTPTTILPHTGGSGPNRVTLAVAVGLLGAAFALGGLTWLKRREVRNHE